MNIYVISREGYDRLYWGERYMAGICDEAKSAGDSVIRLDTDRLGSVGKSYAIFLSSSCRWIGSVMSAAPDIRPILLTESVWPGVSFTTFDYAAGVRGLLEGFRSKGYSRTALVSCNPDSLNDVAKKNEFIRCCGNESPVYYFHRSIGSQIFTEFIRDIEQYDSVICTNDIILFMLKKQLAAAGIDTSGFGFSSFGDRKLYRESKVNYALTDYYELGRSAVCCCRHLNGSRCDSTLSVRLGCKCDNVKLDGGSKVGTDSFGQLDFLDDSSAIFAQQLKFLLGGADSTDVELLKLALEGCSYEEISGRLYMSVNSLKRRMKNMIETAGCASKNELIEILRQYL